MKKKSTLLCFRSGNIIKIFLKLNLLAFVMLISINPVTANDHFRTNRKTLNDKSNSTKELQQNQITGTVTDSKGQPVIGASVIFKGTIIGVNTDVNGKFQLSVPSNANTLVISFIGMKQQEVDITGKTSISILLENETIGLEEVVIVGYGTQKKETITGSVAAISAKEIIKSPVANISNAIVGKMPGLLTFQRSSEPGNDGVTMRIRGIGTFNGSVEPLLMVDGVEVTGINNIDPNEIETVSVLKDASATAVYGVRGANGVLLITTKRGQTGKPQFSYTSNVALTMWTDKQKTMRGYDFAYNDVQAQKYDSYITGNFNPIYTAADIEHWRLKDDPMFHPDVDWTSYFYKDKTWQTTQNLSVNGGTEAVKYFISIGYLNQGGLMNNTDLVPGYYDIQIKYKRYNFRSNFDFNITKRLTARVNLSSQTEDKRGMNGDYEGLLRNFSQNANPVSTPGIVDGKFIFLPGISPQNPVLQMYNNGYLKRFTNTLNGTLRLNYKLDFITEGLSAHGLVNYSNRNVQSLVYSTTFVSYKAIPTSATTYVLEPSNFPTPVSASESPQLSDKFKQTTAEFGFDYGRTFGDHTLGGLFLYNQTKIFNPTLSYAVPHGYQGLVGRATYDFRKRYLAEFDFGYNGTENFAPGKRFGFFPAYSLGWVLSEEPFFPKNHVVTYTKLRGSYGEVGNDNIGGARFLYRDNSYTYYGTSYYFGEAGGSYNPQTGSREGLIGNQALTWERAKKTDIGIELSLFNGKIKISADYFYEMRSNILATKNTAPALVAVTLPALNFGKMRNTGYDGEISFNGSFRKFSYWLKGNYTYAHNTVLEMDEVYTPWSYQRMTGMPAGQVTGNLVDGFLYNTWDELNVAYRPKSTYNNNRQQPGDLNLKDINGDGLIDSYDCIPIGYSRFPEISYSFSFGGDYKGFYFSALFQGTGNCTWMSGYQMPVGGWIAANVASAYHGNGVPNGPQYLADYGWTPDRYEQGLPIKYPHFDWGSAYQQQNKQFSTFWAKDASYLRLKNVEIGYTFTGGLLKRAGISSARVYLTGNNLITWDHMFPGWDPETYYTPNNANSNYQPLPKTKIYNLGVNINF